MMIILFHTAPQSKHYFCNGMSKTVSMLTRAMTGVLDIHLIKDPLKVKHTNLESYPVNPV